MKCIYEGKWRIKCLIYALKFSLCDTIYIGNTPHKFKKRMDNYFSDVQCLLKIWKKSDSFATHFRQHFQSNTSRMDLRKCMKFKVNSLNPIAAMKPFTEPNCNLCMQERLSTLKNLRDKCVTLMNNNLEIYRDCPPKKLLSINFPKHW